MYTNIKSTSVYKEVISDENIFSAIYSLKSYIFEKNLLSNEDLDLYYALQDQYNKDLIRNTIKQCKEEIESILSDFTTVFKIQVYFKAKKLEFCKSKKTNKVICRPLHSADLLTQICIVSLLNVVMFKKDGNGKRSLSDLSQLIPSSFYGNLPSEDYRQIFYRWQDKYKLYTDNILETYRKAQETGAYKYEVCLDLKDYFPSLSPQFLYKFISKNVETIYKDEEKKAFDLVLHKLLYFEVTNLSTSEELKQYYKSNTPEEIHFSLGVPQGLPQSYYFGNIGMIPIVEEFKNIFSGESFYYVDDSTIYTNSENASKENFESALNKLNRAINKLIKQYVYNSDTKYLELSCYKYHIEVHTEDKSTRIEILTESKLSRKLLQPFAFATSRVSYDVYSTLNNYQDISLEKKIDVILEAIKSELTKYDTPTKSETISDDEKTHIKFLKRYKKFFLYRQKLVGARLKDSYLDELSDFRAKYNLLEQGSNSSFDSDDLEKIFNLFDEDIFLAEAQLYCSCMSEEEQKIFKKDIFNFEERLIPGVNNQNLYFSQSLNFIYPSYNAYFSLEKESQREGVIYRSKQNGVIESKLKEFLHNPELLFPDMSSSNTENKFTWFGYGKGSDIDIFKHSNEYVRKILNTYFSRLFDISISDELQLVKRSNRPLTYRELRIIIFIRNPHMTTTDFLSFLSNILAEQNGDRDENVESSIYSVLAHFMTYVKDPFLVDQLILTHKCVSGIWKNGAKFLHFYTLHNQEHAIALINTSIHLSKVIDFVNIKKYDYFILFLSCYLHDISMALHPKLQSFCEDRFETDIIYTSFIAELYKLNLSNSYSKKDVKAFLLEYFNKVMEYFENEARVNHTKASANFIRNSNSLYFINPSDKGNVANIAEAHGFSSNDVYGLKSKANSELISEKYLMILLRLADLLDINKDRISLDLLSNNIDQMPAFSRYHWVTHSAINKVKIYSDYQFNPPKNDSSSLAKENFTETLIVELVLNASNLTSVPQYKCKNAQACLNLEKQKIEISLGEGHCCEEGTCTFLCKWIVHKNNYLLSELNAFQKYLERHSGVNLIFKTDIKIVLNFKEAKPLTSTYFDIVNEQIKHSTGIA